MKSISECPSRKGKKVDDNFRWFHESENSQPDLCCKLDRRKSWHWVGFKYKLQTDLRFCMSEVRPLKPEACCRVQDEEVSIGFLVHQIRSEGYMTGITPTEFYFGKGSPVIHKEDISYAVDYDGHTVLGRDVYEFLLENFAGTYHRYNPGKSLSTFTCYFPLPFKKRFK